MSSAKSLFRNIFHVTPTRSIFCVETLRNSMKTGIRGGGGGGGCPALAGCPSFGCPTQAAGCPIRAGFARVGLLSSLARKVGAPSFPRFWERVGILVLLMTGAALAQQPITDPAKLQSKTIENMQT